jgi:hypothetical protein
METALSQHEARLVHDLESFLGPKAVENSPETQRVLRAMRTLGYVSK